MKSRRLHPLLLAAMAVLAVPLAADQHVAVTAIAKEEYTQRKFENGRPRIETYVVMQGQYYEGATADRSIEKMPFRRIAEYLAPELAKQAYLPCKDPAAADLLLVVHWGTTVPRLTSTEMRGQVSPVTDMSNTAAGYERQIQEYNERNPLDKQPALLGQDLMAELAAGAVGSDVDRQLEFDGFNQIADEARADFTMGTNARLLGYDRELRKLAKHMVGNADDDMLRSDLAGERYFIIVRAYDLKEKIGAGVTRRAVWTTYLNIRSPGQNFPRALNLMGAVAAGYFGRTTEGVRTAKVTPREGQVVLAPVVILGEQK